MYIYISLTFFYPFIFQSIFRLFAAIVYYSALKRKEILPFVTVRMNLEDIMLREKKKTDSER